ncbi:hypothetical protein [Sphingobium sp.]|uniref:hypothetical protein n=1 Tax=Sphingobium sp. TaxID=1912891 RepID=UPI000C4ABBAE|nr:hypothetical protein [Sphingobium sp.]MBS87140.1 hypothetical protein [Sphingobium sp.]
MANPFGIEQVDIPSMLGMHQQMKRQRIADLMQAREYEMKAKDAERQDRKDEVLARLFMKGGDQNKPAGGVTPPVADTPPDIVPQAEAPARVPENYIDPAGAAAMRSSMGDADYEAWKAKHGVTEYDPSSAAAALEPARPQLPALDQPLPPRTDGLAVNMDALRELYAIDPQGAAQIQRLVHDSDKQQLEKAQARGEAMAVAATSLRNLPAGQRQAEFQRNWAPYLIERGYDPAMLQQADLSDDGLERYYRQGRSIEKIVSSAEGERDYRLRAANQEIDNARADRADARAARGEARADRADARASVRFKERDKDRAALAASGGGVRTDLSDLNY